MYNVVAHTSLMLGIYNMINYIIYLQVCTYIWYDECSYVQRKCKYPLILGIFVFKALPAAIGVSLLRVNVYIEVISLFRLPVKCPPVT